MPCTRSRLSDKTFILSCSQGPNRWLLPVLPKETAKDKEEAKEEASRMVAKQEEASHQESKMAASRAVARTTTTLAPGKPQPEGEAKVTVATLALGCRTPGTKGGFCNTMTPTSVCASISTPATPRVADTCTFALCHEPMTPSAAGTTVRWNTAQRLRARGVSLSWAGHPAQGPLKGRLHFLLHPFRLCKTLLFLLHNRPMESLH
jgi:hypothetical protein